jgi:ferritin
MMISEKLQKAINQQINQELYSEYLYLVMAAYCQSIDLPGFANWLLIQNQEEHQHAMRFFNYLIDRDGKVKLAAIDKPDNEFSSALDVFEKVLIHEQKVTKLIHNLYALSVKENDYAAQVELQWFINEQVEEEKNAKTIIQQLKWIGDNTSALFMMDQKMAARTLTAGNPTNA